MNRRAFLASLATLFALDPERALWVPGAKMISIPAPTMALAYDGHLYGHLFYSLMFDEAVRNWQLQYNRVFPYRRV